MAGSNANYDTETISIGSWGIHEGGRRIKDLGDDIADATDRILKTLNSLMLDSWLGTTQQEAEDFSNRWLAVMKEIFGTEAEPGAGVLNAIVAGIGTAGDNYSRADNGLLDVWTKFAAAMPTSGGGNNAPSTDVPPDQMDTNKTAITADY
ncbi:hypothetical protein GCM10027176_00010 [Actinoallomurus bryophytorum]|uniref:WXG100 family type VII secretion target n=1 Tax=Actinoallomurus bryophytorum TaxID=1490222 RepID=A0A543CTT0_9ACTN|nr:hypothetical protein [Actinoallomurus bryophytorum]TQM00505.1 hypothetical protein FB559_6218 [Actinoallomurus bryophytorum]